MDEEFDRMTNIVKVICFCFISLFTFNTTLIGARVINSPKADSVKRAFLQILQIQSYEDNFVGYTYDSDDVSFIDFTFSARTRIYPFDFLMNVLPKSYRQDLHLNFAFTARFGQYIGTRYSSPVIEKRFNPYLFLKYTPKVGFRNTSLIVGYGHESNGQSINDSVTFFKTAGFPHYTVNEAKDYISRGWDYYGSSIISDFFPHRFSKLIFETDVSVKYYLSKGFLQGDKEEYRSWERAWSGVRFTRNEVNGISVSITCLKDSSLINRISVGYETGIAKPLFNNSIKVLLGFNVGRFPLALTYRYGYNGDISQYGKQTGSLGLTVIMQSFERPYNKMK